MTLDDYGHDSIHTPELALRRTFKDSVFTNLFSEPRYAYELYRSLHPEDQVTTLEDVRIVTIQNALTSDEHNDLGFIVGDTLLVLVEAQSTWSPNIALRALLYAAQTIKNLVHERALNIYGTTPISLPRPELYVIYTGQRANVPKTITLSEALFEGASTDLESTVHIINEVDPSLPGQYIDFARTMDAWRIELGANENAVKAAITECLRRGILTEYLAAHETEVVSIMMTLYDEEEVLRNYLASERREAVAKGLEEGLEKGLEKGLKQGLKQGREEGLEQGLAQGREQGIEQGRAQGLVIACKDFGLTQAETATRVADKLAYPLEEAAQLVERYWPA